MIRSSNVPLPTRVVTHMVRFCPIRRTLSTAWSMVAGVQSASTNTHLRPLVSVTPTPTAPMEATRTPTLPDWNSSTMRVESVDPPRIMRHDTPSLSSSSTRSSPTSR